MFQTGAFGAPSQESRSHQLSKRLEKIVQANEGYHFLQQNGQRIFETTPDMKLEAPPAGCEVFIGNIPKYIFEDELIPMFQSVGKLYRFRLMLDFNHRTRGYGFATYFSTQDASDAISKFDGFEIQPNNRLGVYKSLDNRRLFVGNIPKNKSHEEVIWHLTSYINGVINVIIYPSWQDRELNRGFAFIEFESHLHASLARRQLHPRNLVIWGQSLYVDWAEPIPEVDPNLLDQVSVLYVKNLPFAWSNDRINCIFQNLSEGLITKTHKINTYAFVHCKNRRAAEVVMGKLDGVVLDGQELQVEWARPRQYSTRSRAGQPRSNFCLNVPLRSRRVVKQMAESRRAFQSRSDSDSDQAGSYSP